MLHHQPPSAPEDAPLLYQPVHRLLWQRAEVDLQAGSGVPAGAAAEVNWEWSAGIPSLPSNALLDVGHWSQHCHVMPEASEQPMYSVLHCTHRGNVHPLKGGPRVQVGADHRANCLGGGPGIAIDEVPGLQQKV